MTGYRSELAALLSLCFSAHRGRSVLRRNSLVSRSSILPRCSREVWERVGLSLSVTSQLTESWPLWYVVVMMSFALAESAGIPIRPKNGSIIRRRLWHTNFPIWYVSNAVARQTSREIMEDASPLFWLVTHGKVARRASLGCFVPSTREFLLTLT